MSKDKVVTTVSKTCPCCGKEIAVEVSKHYKVSLGKVAYLDTNKTEEIEVTEGKRRSFWPF
jgi:hypothetical protein